MDTLDTTTQILQKLGRLCFENWTLADARITFDDFARVLFSPECAPQYCSLRTVRDKWITMQVVGFARLCNKNTLRFDLDHVRTYLEAVA